MFCLQVVYVPSTSSTASTNQDNLEYQTALLRERNIMQSAQTSIQYPPHIPISKDGEEGYIESQNKLDRHRKADLQNVCFRPPPNKTVYDKDSPPPYSSRSTSSLDSISHAKSSSLVTDINGCPVLRCYSMSENNNHSCFQQQQQFSRNSVSCRQIRQTDSSTGMSMDRPPDYPGAILGTNNSVYHNSAAPAKNSV